MRSGNAPIYSTAFGNIMESTGNVDNNITYAGYQYDEETGLYYLNARMYDPKIARFLQEDTYRGDPNDPLSLNLYAYVKNNPLVYYDPTGHNYIEIFGIPFGNPLEGLKILSDPQKREEAYDLIEEHGDLNFAEKRFYSLVTGYGEISAGMIKAGRDVLDSGYVQKPMLEAGRKLGFIDDDLVYEIMKEEIDDKLERNKKTLKNAPKAIYNGIIESASNVVNKENAYNFFINPDTSFNELVDYSRDTISTGLTVYGGAKMLQSGHNLLKSIRVETIPSAVTSFGQITPSTLSVTIDAGLAGNFARSAGFLGGINFATTNNKGTSKTLNSFDDVADYIKKNGKLPDNFITKDQAKALGWDPKKGNLADVAPGKSIGGDIFKNKGTPLPDAPGRVWYEADINYSGGFRGTDRIIYSNDGLIYKTSDHYKTFTQIK